MRFLGTLTRPIVCLMLIIGSSFMANQALAQAKPTPPKPDFPPHTEVLKDYKQIISTVDKTNSLYKIYVREKDSQVLAELPKTFMRQKYYIALTVASGERFAGLQAGELYVYWKRYDKRLALIEPNIRIRSTGDQESKDSVERLFTDRVLLDVPILTIVPNGGPVIDLDALLVDNAAQFFGGSLAGANRRLMTIKTVKAFPNNVEIAFEVPVRGGTLRTMHYSISLIPDNTGYKPRPADERIGYFTTSYTDLGKYNDDETRVRYANRWKLEKADPKLAVSPPKQPIEFYLEHTTPVRYRRWVRQGVEYWNQAFEKIGISNAIQVHYQDKANNAHMEKDPEDVRYNFIRWLNNDISTAIGPSRVHPLTGEILDADIILTDGWIRYYWDSYHKIMPQIAMEGFSPETWAWLAKHPEWDPRVRLATPAMRDQVTAELAHNASLPFGGHPLAQVDTQLIGDDEFDGLRGRTSQVNGLCYAASGKAFDIALMRMALAIAAAEADSDDKADEKKDAKDEDKDKEKKEKKAMLDGIPEEFIGPLLAELVAHEVGHTLGLRHNFKASSIYSIEDINSEQLKGKKAHAASVMDYLPVNFRLEAGETQGDYTMLGIGPYDFWAIEYGYSLEKDLKPILNRVSEQNLPFATDEDTYGPDPLARRYDFGANPLVYAQEQIRLAKHHRSNLLGKFVKDGDSWAKTRQGYEMTLSLQTRAVSMMANWIGGAFINRDKKGDPNGRAPIEVVPAAQQRAALQFVIENAFKDEAFGLNAELLRHMSLDQWLDSGNYYGDEATWPVHDRIMGIQASTLTMLMNPTTLRRVFDNEVRTPADQDMLTLPELLHIVGVSIWTELGSEPDKSTGHSARKPMISSLRRNLQQEHLERLIDMALPGAGSSAAYKSISNLATMQLRELQSHIHRALEGNVDAYSKSHLQAAASRIEKALESQMIYNANDLRGGSSRILYYLQDGEKPAAPGQ